MDKDKNVYSVHISNIPSDIKEKQLKEFFACAGDVVEVYVKPSHTSFTYAFVRYEALEDAKRACQLLNKSRYENVTIKVSMSDHGVQRQNFKSITRDSLPKVEGKYIVSSSVEKSVHYELKQSISRLNQNDELSQWLGIQSKEDVPSFMKDFKGILVDMSKIPESVGVESFKFAGSATNKSDLQDMILRYHELEERKQVFKEVDIDLSKSKGLLTTDCEKYF